MLQENIVKVTSLLRLCIPLCLLTSRTDSFTHLPKHDRDQSTFCYQTETRSSVLLRARQKWQQFSLKYQFLQLIIAKLTTESLFFTKTFTKFFLGLKRTETSSKKLLLSSVQTPSRPAASLGGFVHKKGKGEQLYICEGIHI